MQVVILGSGSPLPHPDRAGPATLVRTSAGDLLFDCGRGVLLRLAAVGSSAATIQGVFLTHLHSDHLTDLNDVVTTRWVLSFAPSPLGVFGPHGTSDVVEAVKAMLAPDVSYRLAHHEDLTWGPGVDVTEVDDGVVVQLGEVRVTAAQSDHRPVHPSIAYRIDDGDSSVVIAGDTRPCEPLSALCDGAGVLVHTVVRRDLIEQLGLARLTDVLDYHSSVEDAARTAAIGRVRTLVLTHLVPAPAPGTESEWHAQASASFAGQVVVAADLVTIDA